MCKAWLILDTKPEKGADENKYKILANLINNSTTERDGYFLAVIGKEERSIRTLNFEEYIEFLELNKEAIENASVIAGHMRTSTNTISEKYVHGWKFGKYYTYHNGVNDTTGKSKNDSLDLFKRVFAEKCRTVKQLAERVNKILEQTSGYGAYFLVSPKYQILASANKTSYAAYLNNRYLILVTHKDMLTFRDEFSFKKHIGFGVMTFEQDTTMTNMMPEIYKKAIAEITDKIVVFSNGVPKMMFETTMKSYYSSYYTSKYTCSTHYKKKSTTIDIKEAAKFLSAIAIYEHNNVDEYPVTESNLQTLKDIVNLAKQHYLVDLYNEYIILVSENTLSKSKAIDVLTEAGYVDFDIIGISKATALDILDKWSTAFDEINYRYEYYI